MNIDAYIAGYPEEVQILLHKVRAVIREAAPDATETISYGIPTFKLSGNLVHFAAFKSHIGFYPGPSGISNFKLEISDYKSAKGSIQFPINQPIPFDLIARITRFRVQEQLRKSRK